MKRLCTLLCLSLSASIAASAQQLPNGGFEVWRSSANGEMPHGPQPYIWSSSDTVIQIFGGSVLRPSVLKVGSAHSGDYALCLQPCIYYNTFNNDLDSTGGYLFLGAYNDASAFPFSVPYTSRPSAVEGYYKLTTTITGADTASVIAQFSKAGNFVGSVWKTFTPASTWQSFSAPINWISPDEPDDLAFAMGMGLFDLSIEDTSSRFYLDDVRFVLPNGIRENLFASGDMKVFPNPASGPVHVQLSAAFAVAGNYLTLHNAAGQEVMRCGAAVENVLSAEGLAAGVYFVQLCEKSGSVLHGVRVVVR